MVVDLFDASKNFWLPRFHRSLNDWELGELCGMLCFLNVIKPDPSLCDEWEWTISKIGRFTPKSLYMEFVNDRSHSFSHISIWIPSIPSKVSSFLGNVYLDKNLTPNHL